MRLWEEKDSEWIKIWWVVPVKRESPGKHLYFSISVPEMQRLAMEMLQCFIFFSFWVFTCFRSAFHHASVSKINLNQRGRLSKKIIRPPNEVKSFISCLVKKFHFNPLMKVSRIVSSISVLKQVRYYHWARHKLIVPPQQDCKNYRRRNISQGD